MSHVILSGYYFDPHPHFLPPKVTQTKWYIWISISRNATILEPDMRHLVTMTNSLLMLLCGIYLKIHKNGDLTVQMK